MAVFLGDKRVCVIIDGAKCDIEFYSENLIADGTLLITADDYILQDIEGTYITAKEGDNG